MEGKVGNSGRITSTLEGATLDMTMRVQVEDDAVSIYMRMPELEPELVDA